jgi:hypothetical protein
MRFWKIIGWVTLCLAIILMAVMGVVTAAMVFGVTANLDGIRSEVDAAATKILGREVAIEGSIELVISF